MHLYDLKTSKFQMRHYWYLSTMIHQLHSLYSSELQGNCELFVFDLFNVNFCNSYSLVNIVRVMESRTWDWRGR